MIPRFDISEEIHYRFVEVGNHNRISGEPRLAIKRVEKCIHGRYFNSVGSEPVLTKFWFKTKDEVDLLKKQIANVCVGSDSFVQVQRASTEKKYKKLILYERNENRRILNLETLKRTITNTFDNIIDVITIYHEEKRNPCLIYEIMKDADYFVSTHGFQMTGK
jgi:hypothetical protein